MEQYGTQMGAYINFKVKNNEKVKVRIATSFISIEQARDTFRALVSLWQKKSYRSGLNISF